MSFHLSTWSIKNPIPIILAFLIFSFVGIFSFLNLGIDNTPNIDVSAVSVTVTQRGAGATELETQVTRKIEDAVASLDGIDELKSTIRDGISSTTINFVLGTDSYQATDEVRNAIAQIRSDLPADINEPVVKRLEFSGGSVMTYAVTSSLRSVEDLSNIVDRTIIPELANVAGVGQINRLGGVDREIRIDLKPERLQAYQITATEVNNQIRRFNLNLAGGRSQLGDKEQNIRVLGSVETVAQLSNYPITLRQQATIPLSDLGTVKDSFAEPTQSAFLNGRPIVGFSVLRSTGSTLVTVEKNVRQAVEKLKSELPEDIELELIFTRADAIKGSYQGTIMALVVGCILTIITVGIFLRNWRITLITAVALPLSILPTFWVMKILDYTLNGMTLLALALAVGNLVDDAICMIENIERHLQMGKSPYQAAIDGAKEIGLAVVATTATIVAVFVPVAFMGGVPGQFFQPFGLTVAVSTMFSTLVACTMTPMLSAYLLKPLPKSETENKENRIIKNKPYQNLLVWALGHRITTLLIAIAFFIGSLQLIPYIPKGLFSNGDSGLSTVLVDLPPGTKLSETEQLLEKINSLLQNNSATDKVLATAGNNDQPNSALLYAKLKPKQAREISQQQFQQIMRQKFTQVPGARISFRSSGAGGSGKDLSIILKSKNGELLTRVANQIEKEMAKIAGLVEINSSVSLVQPELLIKPDPKRAADLGVAVETIARTTSLAMQGDNEFNLAKFNLPERQIPIRVQLEPRYRQDIETLKNLRIPNNQGDLIPLSAVAEITLSNGPAQINRFNRYRQVSLEANLQGISLGEAIAQVKALPTMANLPSEISEEPAGDAKVMRDIFARFLGSLSLAVLSIYAILVLLYSNFVYPLVILAALPLSVGGALLGLLVTQKELGLFALIGIVLLMGLVTKNAILLVDFALAGVKKGKSRYQSVIQAGISRLRPILMTSFSTIAGMLPIALELGADGEVRSPMAIAVIGGFTTSTLLTLVIVPVLFTYIDSCLSNLKKIWQQ